MTTAHARKAGALQIRDWGGTGAPILLAHGMAAHTHWWDPVAPRLPRELRAAAFDFRGHGDSDRTADGIYTAETWIEDIETARAALGWDRFILCGHSMGARIAIEYAARHPERLRGLIAIDFLAETPSGRPGRFARARGRPQPVYPDQERMIDRFRLEPDGTVLSAEEMRTLGRHGVTASGEGFTWKFDWRALVHYRLDPIWPHLPEIRVPSLVVRGELSTIIGREELARVAREIPAASGIEIAGAHHHVPLDKPAELARAVAEFAAGLP
jgi:pimeloyl-ACP methyl ester carboxylesterase